MASMGVFSAIMYRQHLYDTIMAKAKAERPDVDEERLKKYIVKLPKAVSFTHKELFQPALKIKICAVVAGVDGSPKLLEDKGDKWGVYDFTIMPNHTLHRILGLLKAPKTNMTKLVLNVLSR